MRLIIRNLVNGRLLSLAVLGILLTMASSCKKGGDDTTPENDHQLIIAFSEASIPFNSVDSVTTTFIAGSDTVLKKGSRGGSFFTVPLSGLETSTYQTQNRMYTSPDSSGIRHMYLLKTSVKASGDATLAAPTTNQFSQWQDNYFFHNDEYNITFVMAKLPIISYFELILPKDVSNIPYKNLYIDRNLYNTVDNTKYSIQSANALLKVADYKGSHINTALFTNFATQAASKAYSSADFSLQLYNEANNDYKVLVKQSVKF